MHPPAHIEALVNARVAEFVAKARVKCPTFAVPTVTYHRARAAAGVAYLHQHKISLSLDFLERELVDMLAETIPHEVAHLLSFQLHRKGGHGREWQSVMRYFGVVPRRCHEYDTEGVGIRRQRRWTYVCGCREHPVSTVRHNKIARGRRYRCLACKGTLVLKGAATKPAVRMAAQVPAQTKPTLAYNVLTGRFDVCP